MRIFKKTPQKTPLRARVGRVLLGFAAIFCSPASSDAATTQAVIQTFSFRSTNWNETVNLELFDSSLGTLTGIVFELQGELGGSMAYESQDGSPQTITMTLGAEIKVGAPSGLAGFSEMVATNLDVQIVENASSFDGTLDFAGDSGSTFSNLSATDTNTTIYDDTNPLWEFSLKDYFTTDTPGTEVQLPVSAVGQGSGTGSGNLALNFLTDAGGQLIVTYIYDPVPEPGSIALIASTALLLGGRRRRRSE